MLPLQTSNTIESPNDHILFERLPRTVEFKNIKTNIYYSVPIVKKEIYHEMYQNLPKDQIPKIPSSKFENGGS